MNASPVRHSEWLTVPRRRPDALVRLICLPHGGTATFWPWADRLPPEIELAAVQVPGRESRIREPAFSRMEDLIREAAEALSPLMSEPFALFGHSIGALHAYELAVAFQKRGMFPVLLIVSGHDSPNAEQEHAASRTEPDLKDLTDQELVAHLRDLGGTPDEIFDDPELTALLLPTFRADAELQRTYTPSSQVLACPISAYGGLEDELTERTGLQRWAERTDDRCNVRMFPGRHFFVESAQDLVLPALAADVFGAATR